MKTATWFHCQLKPISRSDGKSVVNCAAYRTGSKLEDRHYGQTRDYTHKKDVVTSFTLAPEGAPAWATDTEALWNAVEKKENRKNSILSYEWEVALPNELSDAERENIARNIAGWLRDEYGVAVTAGIHNGGDRGNGKNDHAHIFMTTREISEDGWAKNKLRDFNVRPGQDNPNVEAVRSQVAAFINAGLEDAGSDTHVTHESYAARGIEIEGTKHLGPKASALERSGIDTDRAAINRDIVEARLVWQREQAQPEITADLAREFAGRFGDDLPPPPVAPPDREEAPRGTPDDWEEAPPGRQDSGKEASQGTAEDWQTAATGQGSDQRPQHTLWENLASKVRSYWERIAEFANDQTSGARIAQASPVPDADSTAPKSWVERVTQSRVVQAGRLLLHGWGHRDVFELAAGIQDTAAAVEDILAKGPQRNPADKAPDAEATQPDAAAPPAARSQTAFERLAAQATAPQPRARTPSAFDALVARQATPSPGAAPSAPEPDSLTPEP